MRHAYSASIHNDNPSTSSLYKSSIIERWLNLQWKKTRNTAAINNPVTVDENRALKRTVSRQSLLKRTFSLQFLSALRQPKLDRELCEKIKLRYKDTSKFTIWPECPLPAEFNQKAPPFKTSKWIKAVNYNHSGNHQAEVMRQNNMHWDAEIRRMLRQGQLDTSAFQNPDGFIEGRTKFYYQASVSSPLPTIEEVRFRDKKNAEDLHVAHLDNIKTPLPRHVINSVQRSESSDDDESLIGLTASDQELEVEPHELQL